MQRKPWKHKDTNVARKLLPSGVAAAALKECGINASTLHSLEARINLAQKIMDDNAGKPLTQGQRDFINSAMLTNKDVLIINEAGMVSAKQLSRVMEMVRQSGAKLVQCFLIAICFKPTTTPL